MCPTWRLFGHVLRVSMSELAIWHKPSMDRCGSPDYMEDSAHSRRNPAASVFAKQDQGIDG